MPRVNYKYFTIILSIISLTLLVFNICYFFVRPGVGIRYYYEKLLNPPKDAILLSQDYRNAVDEYERLNKLLTSKTIVFLGDSITKGYNVYEYLPGRSVVNRGLYSDTTISLVRRLEKNVNNIKISKLFLLIGYNDLQYRSNAEIVNNIDVVLDGIHAEKIYLQSILPVDKNNIDINLRIVVINEGLKRISRSRNVEYVDLHSHFVCDSGGISEIYSQDGVHLTGKGYRLWTEIIKNII